MAKMGPNMRPKMAKMRPKMPKMRLKMANMRLGVQKFFLLGDEQQGADPPVVGSLWHTWKARSLESHTIHGANAG